MQKRFYTILSTAIISTISLAQTVSDGFYRVQNYGSKRYAYVYDCTGSINVQSTSADMGAIVLYKDANKRFSDPASVIYVNNKGASGGSTYLYDLETQGTGVYKIISYYVSVTNSNVAGTYWVYEPKFNQYLCDPVSSTAVDKSYVDTKKVTNGDLKCWSIYPVSASTDEYLGIAPDANMQAGGKYYKPYYLGFAMNLASSGMKAYYVSDVKADAVIIKEITGTIPAATPVIIECSSADASKNRVEPLYNTSAKISGNKLSGNFFCYGSHAPTGHAPTAYKVYSASTMRVLTVKDGRLYYATDPDGKHTTYLTTAAGKFYCLNPNESYLEVPAGSPAELPVMTQAEYDALHPSAKKGDINGDGIVNATDALVLYRLIAAGTTASAKPEADINGDGLINSTDALVLYRLIAAGQ